MLPWETGMECSPKGRKLFDECSKENTKIAKVCNDLNYYYGRDVRWSDFSNFQQNFPEMFSQYLKTDKDTWSEPDLMLMMAYFAFDKAEKLFDPEKDCQKLFGQIETWVYDLCISHTECD